LTPAFTGVFFEAIRPHNRVRCHAKFRRDARHGVAGLRDVCLDVFLAFECRARLLRFGYGGASGGSVKLLLMLSAWFVTAVDSGSAVMRDNVTAISADDN